MFTFNPMKWRMLYITAAVYMIPGYTVPPTIRPSGYQDRESNQFQNLYEPWSTSTRVLRKLNHGSNSWMILSYLSTENNRIENDTKQIKVNIIVFNMNSRRFSLLHISHSVRQPQPIQSRSVLSHQTQTLYWSLSPSGWLYLNLPVVNVTIGDPFSRLLCGLTACLECFSTSPLREYRQQCWTVLLRLLWEDSQNLCNCIFPGLCHK